MARKRMMAVLATGLVGAGIVISPSVATAADIGDGKLGCNVGEFCYGRDDVNTQTQSAHLYQKHFWYGGNDDNLTFTNISSGVANGGGVRDQADMARNRDTACDFWVVDDRGILADDYNIIPRDSLWYFFTSAVDDENDRRERC